ncbi:MAG TPA: RNA polymerase sigma factor [Oceanospirillales bacterium]|nr:RNA polymerase sigma factor [Oceanospirillales bacterium]
MRLQLHKSAEKSIDKDIGIEIKSIPVPAAETTDAEIIARIKTEGFKAYGELVKRYNQRLFRIARSIITDDAAAMDMVQEAHIKAYTQLHSFQGTGSFAAWLAGITRNQALMYLRKHKREVMMTDEEHNKLESNQVIGMNAQAQSQPDELFQNRQMQTLINKNLDKLSEKFRSVFVLRAVEQFSTKETAHILKINELTVKTRFFRAKRFLRKEIQNYLDTSDLKIYEFGNKKCDLVLFNVLTAISKLES